MIFKRLNQCASMTLGKNTVVGRYRAFGAVAVMVQLLSACSASNSDSDDGQAGRSSTAGGAFSSGTAGTFNVGGGVPIANGGAVGGLDGSSGSVDDGISGAPGSAAGNGGTPTSAGGSGAGGGRNGGASGGRNGGTGGGRNGGSAGSGSGGTGSAGAGSAGGGPVSAKDPVIPAISGTCPTLATGTATIGGLSGISLQVGPKKQGTGSLVFYWHGTGSSAGEVNALMPAAARQEILDQGGMIVSFQGSLGTGGDCSGTGIFSKDDFKVADLIAACAVRDQGIDPHRIYTTGCSAGGLQAGCMGALRSSYIAATAPNSGGEVGKLTIEDPSRTPAVMTMHGGSSDMVIVSFATTSASYDKQMKGAGSFVINCNHGAGHCGAPATLQSAAWEFMKAHPFGVAPEPYSSALPSTFPSYCMIQ